MNRQRLVVLIGSVAGLVSVFLPWISIEAFQLSMNVNGFGRGETPTDAFVSLILFGVMLALVFIGNRSENFSILFSYGLVATAGLSFIFGLVEFFAVNEKVKEVGVQLKAVKEAQYQSGSVGYGIYIGLVASLVILIWIGRPLLREKLTASEK